MLQLPVADLKQTRFYQEVYGEGRQEGRQEGQLEGHQRQVRMILRQLQRRLGPVTGGDRERVATLSPDDLEALGEALLDFTSAADLAAWLAAHGLAAPPGFPS
jgi:predicted transposase YdaD